MTWATNLYLRDLATWLEFLTESSTRKIDGRDMVVVDVKHIQAVIEELRKHAQVKAA